MRKIIMAPEYQTRQDLLEENEGFEEALSEILDECKKPNPSIDFIEGAASEALGVEEESDDDLEDEIEDE